MSKNIACLCRQDNKRSISLLLRPLELAGWSVQYFYSLSEIKPNEFQVVVTVGPGDWFVEELKKISDPEIPVNIYELGLIYSIDCADEGGSIKCVVTMTLTSVGCPVSESLVDQVRNIGYVIDDVKASPKEGCDHRSYVKFVSS